LHTHFYPELNLSITTTTATSDQPLTHELKRSGFLIDRGLGLSLRPEDELIVYISLGGFEK
jgi:hypothetical protein